MNLSPCPSGWNFHLYCPPGGDDEITSYYRSKLACVRPISGEEFDRVYREFDDFGEINRGYTGFQTIRENFVLVMTGAAGPCAGFLVFKPKNLRLVEVDILVVKKELRGLGLGRLMYGCFEAGCEDGTVLYIERVTELGRKFFARCGFGRDVDYYKVLAEENRVTAPFVGKSPG